MSRRLWEPFAQGKAGHDPATVANYLSLVLAVVAGLLALESALKSRDTLAAAAWAFCFIALGAVAMFALRRPRRPHLEPTTIFRPFEPNPPSQWERPKEVEQLTTFLTS